MNHIKKAFTLVELLVVITILTILGTIAFVSLQGYSRDSRNSVRISDLKTTEKALELYSLQTGNYPEPDNNTIITIGTGSTQLWNKGEFDTGLLTKLKKINKLPRDPKTDTLIEYSTTLQRKEYELKYDLELAAASPSPLRRGIGVRSVQANSTTPYVKGTYNGVFLVGKDKSYYAVPGLFTGTGNVTDPTTFDLHEQQVDYQVQTIKTASGVTITTTTLKDHYQDFTQSLKTILDTNPDLRGGIYDTVLNLNTDKYEDFAKALTTGDTVVLASLTQENKQQEQSAGSSIIGKSLLLNGVDQYFTRSVSEGNKTKWTFSTWMKLGTKDSFELFTAGTAHNPNTKIEFVSGYPSFKEWVGGDIWQRRSSQILNDRKDWHHVVWVYDSTVPTTKIYIDGEEVSGYSIASDPSLNHPSHINNSTYTHSLGARNDGASHYDGYLSDTYFIDGQALSPNDFAKIDIDTGKWVPQEVIPDTWSTVVLSSDVVPAMTGFTSPSGTVTAQLDNGGDAWKAFNNSTVNGWYSHDTPGWISYDFGSGNEKIITGYSIARDDSIYYDIYTPKDFTFEGWNGSSWVVLHTVTGESLFTQSEVKTYSFENTTAYQKYRLYITATPGNGYNDIYVGEIELFESEILIGYGTNGFHLDFSDATDLGKDSSGNNNNWTPNNIIQGGGLLIHSDTTNATDDVLDSSGQGHVITKNGDATHSTTQKQFGQSSLYFDGNGDYLSISDSDDWYFGDEDFTADMWMYWDGSAGAGWQALFCQDINDNNSWRLDLSDTTGGSASIRFYSGTPVISFATSDGIVLANTWYHIAVVRKNNTITLYVNGIAKASINETGVFPNLTQVLAIGHCPSYGTGRYYSGYMDEIRITKGKALWTSDFPGSLPGGPASSLDTGSPSQVSDSPINNYTTWDLGSSASGLSFSNGNLDIASSSYWKNAIGTLGVNSGLWYYEATLGPRYGSYQGIGFTSNNNLSSISTSSYYTVGSELLMFTQGDEIYADGVRLLQSIGYYDNTVRNVGFALDLNNNKFYVRVDGGSWLNGGDPIIGTGGFDIPVHMQGKYFYPIAGPNNVSASDPYIYTKFTEDTWSYSVPTGFKALSSQNIE